MCGTGARCAPAAADALTCVVAGAASNVHVLPRVERTAAWSESTAETCGTTGGTMGSRCASAL
eukprot:6846074-Prymnesium_polylepis.1